MVLAAFVVVFISATQSIRAEKLKEICARQTKLSDDQTVSAYLKLMKAFEDKKDMHKMISDSLRSFNAEILRVGNQKRRERIVARHKQIICGMQTVYEQTTSKPQERTRPERVKPQSVRRRGIH